MSETKEEWLSNEVKKAKSEFKLSEKADKQNKNLFYIKDIKQHIQNLKRRLKEEIERGVIRNKVFPLDWCFDSIDKLFLEEIGKELLEEKE